MNDAMLHPMPDRLEAFAEGSLSDGDRAVVASHILSCTRCHAEVEEWRALFSVLAELPTFSPAPGFASRVLAGVALPRPWYVRAGQLISGVLPRTTRGWVLATGFVSLPGLMIVTVVCWLLTRPGLTGMSLLTYAQTRVGGALLALAREAAGVVLNSEIVLWLAGTAQALVGPTGLRSLGTAAALFAVLTAISIWVLYRYLFQTSTRESRYASYSF